MQFDRSLVLQPCFHRLIPGGAHTYAKGDDQYPEQMPIYISRGQGSRVWDVDGNEFLEYGAGLRSVGLGHAEPRVVQAASRQMNLGSNFVRPALIELECAKALQAMIAGAEMVKFGKHGSDITSAALKLARAFTGRELVAICAEHPFFSVDDWFIGSTPMAAGIPDVVRRLTLKFHYNDLASLEQVFAQHPRGIAAVVLEAEKDQPPLPGYLEAVQSLCRREGAILVFDEMITGFRWHNGGAQAFFGVCPDLSCFGKALGNGFSVSALVGRREVMERGGLHHPHERVFLLSTTHGAETHALAAAHETMRIYREEPVVATLWARGERLAAGVRSVVNELGMAEYFEVRGRPCCLTYATRGPDRRPSQPFRTLFLQETMKRGLLLPSLVVGYAHSEADVDRTIEGIRGGLLIYQRALEDGIERFLEGRPVKPVFRTFN